MYYAHVIFFYINLRIGTPEFPNAIVPSIRTILKVVTLAFWGANTNAKNRYIVYSNKNYEL